MRHFTAVISAVLFAGCQPQSATPVPKAESASPAESPSPAPAAMTLVAMTDVDDASGKSQDQKIETADATPENVTRLFHGLDWEHASNGCGIALTRNAGSSSADRAKLSINLDSPEEGAQRVITASLEEIPPGDSEEKFFEFQPLKSPDVGLQLLLSFLAQDGKYRTMVEWRER